MKATQNIGIFLTFSKIQSWNCPSFGPLSPFHTVRAVDKSDLLQDYSSLLSSPGLIEQIYIL